MNFFAAVVLVLLSPALIAAPELAGPSASLQGRIAKARSPELRWPNWTDYRPHVAEFYKRIGGRPTWVQGGVPTPQALEVAAKLARADLKGLSASAYEGDRWPARMAALSSCSESELEAFDVAFTVSVMRYLSDVRLGRINPAKLAQGFDGKSRRLFLVEFAVDLTTAQNPGARMEQIEPSLPGYRALLAQIPRLLELSKRPFKPIHAVKKLAQGDTYPDAQALAELLVALVDLTPEDAKALPEGYYMPPLAAAVMRFQVRHGLDADGKLGTKTVVQLNTPFSRRLTQIRLTLERWRWVQLEPAPRMIQVNIPAFNLSALSAKGGGYQTDLWMRVVVGKALLHQTHLLAGKVDAVIFRPTWDVPRGILQHEILPKLRKHPSLLGQEGYEMVPVGGAGAAITIPTAAAVEGLATGKLRLIQKPGPRNALGHVKFLFTNSFQIYLHDTPAQTAFESSRRDFSHGCIRLEHPADLATWVLGDTPGWNAEKVKAEMAAEGSPSTVPVTSPIQVVIVYGTVTVDGTGKVYFYDDIYGNDKRLARALAAGYPYRW